MLVLAAWAVLACALSGVPAPDPEADGTLIPQLERVLAAASAGHLFCAAPGESFVLPAYDLGMFAWPSLAIVAAKATCAPAWQPGLLVWIQLQYALFAVAVLVCALPAVPFRLSTGAVLFLLVHVVGAGADPLGGLFAPHYYGYWAPPLGALVGLVWALAISGAPRPGRWTLTVAAALFIGFLGTWRVDAALIPALGALALGGRALCRRAFGTAALCAALVLVSRVPDLALREALAVHQAVSGVAHFEDGGVRGHLVWHNLYLSYASVPLAGPRAEWDDTVGWLHATEYEPRLTTAQSRGRLSADHDRALLGLYATTASEHPLLWLGALAKRAGELADLCWPSLVLTGITLLLWQVMAGGALEPGPFRIACQLPARSPEPAWAALCMLGAAALPPLLYSTLPWYARAAQMTARALPWLLALAGAGTRRDERAVPARACRVAWRLAACALGALVLWTAAGELARLAYVAGLDGLDLAGWARRWDEDARRLRVHLPDAPPATLASLAAAMRARFGVVKGGGVLDLRDRTAPARVLCVARVGLHVVVWLRGTAPWPPKGSMRAEGGWLDLALDGPCPGVYRARIPAFDRDQIVPVLIPVAPADDTPVTARMSLRAWPLTTGAQALATVHGLTRGFAW